MQGRGGSDRDDVSIHAPHEGERRLRSVRDRSDAAGFNPRSPRGGATLINDLSDQIYEVSIHAPHEGERLCPVLPAACCSTRFNPRSPRGGATPAPKRTATAAIKFQSTLPTRGSDEPYGVSGPTLQKRFNPRSPRGGATLGQREADAQAGEFQSTLPTRGSDRDFKAPAGVYDEFQSTLPTRGSDLTPSSSKRSTVWVSIHAPHEGERRTFWDIYTLLATVSIHAPHEGERPFYCALALTAVCVSIHAPHEGERL